MTIRRIQNSNEWAYDIHCKSVENDRSFKEQLLIDTLYTLSVEDNILTLDEANRFLVKYKSEL